MMRLSNTTLAGLAPTIATPGYDRARLSAGIVHLGLGAFHRGHQAVMTDDLLAEDPSWGILGVSLRSRDVRDALAPQDNLYSLNVMDGTGARRRIIGALTGVLVAPESPVAILDALSAPATRIVSTTVTEKGYSHDPATGALREDDPDIRHDLANPLAPRTTLGMIAQGLRRRKQAGLKPFTVLACDNLPSNGQTLRGLTLRFAELLDRDFASWVEDEVRFPSTMVDRIVPATTDADRASVSVALGIDDAAPIMTEPFCQWVVEDSFTLGRPEWERAGAQFVTNVEPYELMKLRLLNGSHSTLAYLGYLAGYQTVSDAMGDAALARLVEDLMTLEASPTLPALQGFDVAAYRASLLQRFCNPALKHRTWQIAMDGSQKLPQRLLGTIRDRLEADAPIRRLSLGVAAWMRYVTGIDENGSVIDVRDPLAPRLKALAQEAGQDASRLVDALLSVHEIFGADLPRHSGFRAAVTSALGSLFQNGAARTIRLYEAQS